MWGLYLNLFSLGSSFVVAQNTCLCFDRFYVNLRSISCTRTLGKNHTEQMLQQDKAQHDGKKNEFPFINLVFIKTDVLGYTEKSYCFF